MTSPVAAAAHRADSNPARRPAAPASGAVPAQGSTVHVLGNLITFLLRGQDTGMAFSMVECRTAPGAGSPPHLHTADEEAFHVLEGTYEFRVAGRSVTAGPGQVVTVKRGQPHIFRNAGEMPARMLILNWPADMHERFFAAIGDPVAPGTTDFPAMGAPDMPKILAAATASGIELLPPQAV
jgi:quercetin dioxygenase-like cupin family protein